MVKVGTASSILLRVFFETADGGYYSPFVRDGFEVLPIPEFIGRFKRKEIALRFTYSRIPCRYGRCSLSKYLPVDYVLIGGSSYSVNEVIAHWDPRLDIGVYSDYWRYAGGRIPKSFRNCREGCYLFFVAGLAKYPHRFFSKPHGFTEIRRTFMRVDRGIYVVAYMEASQIIDLTEVARQYGIEVGGELGDEKVWEVVCSEFDERICETPHRARGIDLPVVILSDNYGFLKRPIPIMEWREGRRLLTNYSYIFGVRSFDDRVRYKVFNNLETRNIIKLLEREGAL